jgi:hypothetical protein
MPLFLDHCAENGDSTRTASCGVIIRFTIKGSNAGIASRDLYKQSKRRNGEEGIRGEGIQGMTPTLVAVDDGGNAVA